MKLKYLPIVLVFCCIVFWFISIVKCEILTFLYKSNFPFPEDIRSMRGDMDYLKVIKYSGSSACVYCVSGNKSVGDTVMFIKSNGEWRYDGRINTVWSKRGGSADEFVWPYFYHSNEGIAVFIIIAFPIIIISFAIAIINKGRQKPLK